MKLNITTLGNFDIMDGDASLLKDAARQYRLYKLLQYFITFRNKKLLPETIIDNLLQDNESLEPKNVLRTQIFRLRQMIKTLIPSEDEADYISIDFVNGYYFLKIGKKTALDIDEFEESIRQGDNLYSTDIVQAKELYNKAISLYKGLYISENQYEVWVVPTRNYYRRLYLSTFFKLIEVLKDEDSNEEILNLCETALNIEPYEENIHICLMEAMLKLGQARNAKEHYNYTVNILAKELGIKSSPRLKNIERRIENSFNEKEDIDLANLSKLDEKDGSGAVFCDTEYFKFLYNIQRRKVKRNCENNYISLISIYRDSYSEVEIKQWGKIMTDILKHSLREGDVFTFWNDYQIVLLLHDTKDKGFKLIENRIETNLKKHGNYNIKILFKPLCLKSA